MVQQRTGSGTATANSGAVMGRAGMVCSSSPYAAAAGVQVLRAGGNAFDAAIAVAAAECVTIPPMCGLGGEAFALLYQASTGRLFGLTGSGRAPQAASREFFVKRGSAKMPLTGPLSASVPGEVHAWQTILDRFGTRPLDELLQPAIRLAEVGFPVLPRLAELFPGYLRKLLESPEAAVIYTRDGRELRSGETLVLRDLARSLRRVAQGGAEEFYRGALARDLASAIQETGGLIDLEDLASHTTTVYEDPPSTTYRGHTVYATGLPSQGFLVLEILNILEGFDLRSMGHNSPDAIHAMVEACRLAFADRLAYAGDPDFLPVPMDRLLSKEFAASRQERISMQGMAGTEPGDLSAAGKAADGNTSYFCLVDVEGNAVSFIHSLSNGFGSAFVAGGTGILLNNRVGRGFYLEQGHPNVIASGKRTINTIHTYMALRDGHPVAVGGTPGGDNQPQWNVQVLANLWDYDMDVQEAVSAARWHHIPGTDPATIDRPMQLRVEPEIPNETTTELALRGHSIAPMPPSATPGAVMLVQVDQETGVRTGGVDPRTDGRPLPE